MSLSVQMLPGSEVLKGPGRYFGVGWGRCGRGGMDGSVGAGGGI